MQIFASNKTELVAKPNNKTGAYFYEQGLPLWINATDKIFCWEFSVYKDFQSYMYMTLL